MASSAANAAATAGGVSFSHSTVRVLWPIPEGGAALARCMAFLISASLTATASAAGDRRKGTHSIKCSFSLVTFKVDLTSPQPRQDFQFGLPISAGTFFSQSLLWATTPSWHLICSLDQAALSDAASGKDF